MQIYYFRVEKIIALSVETLKLQKSSTRYLHFYYKLIDTVSNITIATNSGELGVQSFLVSTKSRAARNGILWWHYWHPHTPVNKRLWSLAHQSQPLSPMAQTYLTSLDFLRPHNHLIT